MNIAMRNHATNRVPVLLLQRYGLYFAICVVMCGCADDRPLRVPVSGTVLIDGQPLGNAFVNFYPQNGRPSSGRTDESGRFVLDCFEDGDGAQLGTHRVTVIAVQEINPSTMKWYAPKHYANHTTSPLQVHIDEPRDDIAITLEWAGGKPFIERSAGGD